MDRKNGSKIISPKLSVIGLGKLGVCTAACFAYKGFRVLGVDINSGVVKAINNGKAPVYEPRLQELINLSKNRLRATSDYSKAIQESDITFFIVPTPSQRDGHFSDKCLKKALKPLAVALKESKKTYHLFVITSTVSPGTIEKNLIPLIERYSEKKLNKGFGICYSPEFIALGDVINGILKPDLVLIGESNKFAGDKIAEIYQRVCENRPYVARMSIISAEITKISLNAYITMKISFANTLGNICERIPNAEIDSITSALGADKRISPYYLKAGLAYAGPCFPRDNKAFLAFAKGYGIKAKLAKTTDEVNRFQIEYLIKKVLRIISSLKEKSVAVLGLSYKPKTPVIEESPAIKLIEELLKKKLNVIVYDPLATENTKKFFGKEIFYASSIKDCFRFAPICIIATPDNDFKKINKNYIKHNPTTVIDCWRILDKSKLGEKTQYIAWGKTNK